MLESKWGLRFVALLLALFMFLSVNDVFDEFLASNGESPESEVIEGMPVEVLYDDEKHYISGAPDQVNVQLFGNTSNVKRLQTTRDFEVFLDLRNRQVGEYEEHFTVDGLPENVTAEVVPETANVNIQELVTRTFEVQAEVSESRVGPNHDLESVQIEPETVTVMGGESEMNRIQYVRATLNDNARITEDRVEEAEVSVFDTQFNKLDVRIDPTHVRVEINVEERSKEVSVNYEVNGEVEEGYTLEDVGLNYDTVEVYGTKEVLEELEEINVEVDVEGLDESTTRDVDIDVPEDVDRTEPAVLRADIEVKQNNG
ncbi:YbbR-like domain-containing protein [Salinicoccus roseus]|uniref:CdaR family protein n=1 Tax=Salinicoccus roseus TaxID=45670 RepID=UPI0023007AC2|nr:CdaR family protein [Salinicoccus roseus]